jgi:hypothetical protein
MLTQAENAQIQHAADIRELSKSVYMRRCALGRRADVRYEMEIVRQLSAVVQAIRAIHSDLLQRGIEPSAEGFRPIIQEARNAMLRIQK